MYVMLSKRMESERKLRLSRNMNLKADKDAEIVDSFNQFESYSSKKSKRFRSAFTTEQVNYLEKEFKKFPYIGSGNRKEIAEILNISDRAVKIWFQNRRMREKKENGNKEMTDQNKSNVELVNGQFHNDHSFETRNGSKSNQSQISDYSYSKKFHMDIPNHNEPIEGMCSSSQNKSKFSEDVNITHRDSKCKSLIDKDKRQHCINRFAKPSHNIIKRRNTSIHSTHLLNESPCAYYDNFKNEHNYEAYVNSMQLNSSQASDIPQDLSAKTKLPQKAPTQNQSYVSVHLNSNQKYVPLYTQNYCNSSLPVGAAVTSGISTVAPGNIIWKPLTVLPGHNLSPVGIPHSNEISVNNRNASRHDCNCNCHGPYQGLSSTQGINRDLRTQPHYILAIPLNSASNKI